MEYKNIPVSKKTKELLEKRMSKNETFDAAVLRLLGKKKHVRKE